MTSSHGHTVLSDFGTSSYFKASHSSSQKQYSDVPVDEPIVGSAYWIAPEIIRMQRATPLSDIWSLGSTLVEMVTGFPPFNKKDPRHVFYILSTRTFLLNFMLIIIRRRRNGHAGHDQTHFKALFQVSGKIFGD